MTEERWFGRTVYPVCALGRAFEVTLGKMLQPSATSAFDSEVGYLNSASVQWRSVTPDPDKTMWAGPKGLITDEGVVVGV